MSPARQGIALMISATLALAIQDGISRHLAGSYNLLMIVMIRYWFFAAFVLVISQRRAGSLRAAASSRALPWQILRGVLLVAEVCVAVLGFVKVGLAGSQALFACYPLLIVLLAGPVLGERINRQMWLAIAAGTLGVAIMLNPGAGILSPWALLPFASALMFAIYSILTRYVARVDDAATSFFWTGVAGAIAITLVGIWHWEPLAAADWAWMGALCVVGALAHYLLIKTYDVAEAASVQPFAYFQIVFVAIIGVTLFGETLSLGLIVGGLIVIAAGVAALVAQRR